MMNNVREIAYRVDPVLWVREVLGAEPAPWQDELLLVPRGASILALTARQSGKTTAAAWAMAHAAVFVSGSLSVVACPAQRQSAEAVRRVREMLLKAGAKLTSDNVYGLEIANGARVLALPGSDDSVRGLTVDAWIVADEAARLSADLISALRPMRARRPHTRLAMLSTAWSLADPFWTAWSSEDLSWIRLRATADVNPNFNPEFLEQERHALGEAAFKREYLGIPTGAGTSPFTWALFEKITRSHTPIVPPGPAFCPPEPEPPKPAENPFQRLKGGLVQ
jgi:Terminase large subunit, T4likevirus-type, N-terminal